MDWIGSKIQRDSVQVKQHLPIILSDKDPDLGPWVADVKWQRA